MTEANLHQPITWSDFYVLASSDVSFAAHSTAMLVRMVAAAEFLMMKDPVRSRSEGESRFRDGLAAAYTELNRRLPTGYFELSRR